MFFLAHLDTGHGTTWPLLPLLTLDKHWKNAEDKPSNLSKNTNYKIQLHGSKDNYLLNCQECIIVPSPSYSKVEYCYHSKWIYQRFES